MRRIEKCSEIVKRPKVWINVEIIGDVVSVIPQRRRIEGQEPNGGNAELLEIIQLFHQAAEVAHPVAVAVAKCFDVQLVDDRVLVPKRIASGIVQILHHAANLCRTNATAQSSDLDKLGQIGLLQNRWTKASLRTKRPDD